MKYTTLTFILTISIAQSFAQSIIETTYQNLSTKKIYATNLSIQTQNGALNFSVNGRNISKYLFDKYSSTWNDLDSCCPCILQLYDENEVLFQEMISCDGYEVGWIKEYYQNGKIRLTGQYQENQSGNWEHILETGKCCVREGKWTYFNTKGDTLYNEFWHNGNFISQVPEQTLTEIWAIELTLDGEHYYSEILTFEQVKGFTITPLFKNSHRDSLDLTINFKIVSPENKIIMRTFTLDNFKNIDVQRILNDANILTEEYSPDEFAIDVVPGDIKTEYYLEICNNGLVIATFQIFLVP